MSVEPITTQTEYAHIVRTEGVVGGEPRIANTRIRVRDIVLARDVQAAMPEEIVATIYPQLTLAQVYSALAYFEDHRDEVNSLQQREHDYLEALHKSPPAFLEVRRGTSVMLRGYADEHVSDAIVGALHARGMEVVSVAQRCWTNNSSRDDSYV